MLAGRSSSEGRALYVLQDEVLQKWTIAEVGYEKVGGIDHSYCRL